MAGLFKTLGSTLSAVDTVVSSGSRRLAVWATEAETQTKYRHVAAMTRIKTESAVEIASELKKFKAAQQDADVVDALKLLDALDVREQQNAARG